MRVLLVTPLVPAAGGTTGGGIVMDGVLRVLTRRHDVTLATLAAERADAPTLAQLEREGVEVHAAHVWRGGGTRGLLRQTRFGLSWLATGRPLRACAFHVPSFQRTLDGLAHRRFDLIQVEDSVMGLYEYPAATPKLLTDHDVRADVRWPERGRWLRLQRGVWPRFDLIQTFTDMDAGWIRSILPEVSDRIRVNPFGVQPLPAAQPAADSTRDILFIGGFKHPPNVDAAVWLGSEIVPRVRRTVPDARLVIVGADPPKAVRTLAGAGVSVTGRVESPLPYLNAAAVVVAPLRLGGGMRVKVLEAMAAGKAVVATPLAAQGLAQGSAWAPLRLADDADGIAQAICDLLEDPAERKRLGEAARAHAIEFRSWDSFGERLDRIHSELVEGTWRRVSA